MQGMVTYCIIAWSMQKNLNTWPECEPWWIYSSIQGMSKLQTIPQNKMVTIWDKIIWTSNIRWYYISLYSLLWGLNVLWWLCKKKMAVMKIIPVVLMELYLNSRRLVFRDTYKSPSVEKYLRDLNTYVCWSIKTNQVLLFWVCWHQFGIRQGHLL